MSRREQAERLLDAIGELPDELVEAAAQPRRRKSGSMGIIAAAILLALLLPAIPVLVNLSVSSGHFGAAEVGANYDENQYAAYQGPVFPLTAEGEIEDITASRQVTLDFSDYAAEGYADGNTLTVDDGYVLYNRSEASQTLTLRYPYNSDGMREMAGETPEIRVDGRTVQSQLLVTGMETIGTATWTDYRLLIEGEEKPTVLSADMSVTLYEFSGIPVSELPGQRFQLELKAEDSAEGVFASGLDGAERKEEGWRLYTGTQEMVRVVVLNGKLQSYGLFAYGNPNKAISAEVRCEETTLGAILPQMIGQDMTWPQQTGEAQWLETALLAGPLASLSQQGDGLLTACMSALEGERRIFYRTFQVTIPANGSVQISVCQKKHPSKTVQNSPEAQENGEGADGYDMVTALGTRIPITKLRGVPTNYDAVEIKDQNFGFAPEQGITEVTLDPEKPEYYINVVKK